MTTSGDTRFYLGSDDGSRLYIDGQLVLNHGGLHPFTEVSALVVGLGAGYHDIRVEMFENFGAAGVVLSWDPAGPTGKQVATFHCSLPGCERCHQCRHGS